VPSVGSSVVSDPLESASEVAESPADVLGLEDADVPLIAVVEGPELVGSPVVAVASELAPDPLHDCEAAGREGPPHPASKTATPVHDRTDMPYLRW
jgi:hypothetical protein